MVEFTRTHERIEKTELAGRRVSLSLGTLFIPARAERSRVVPLVIHFHGAGWLAEWSTSRAYPKAAVLSVNLGAGSGVYSRAFSDPQRFQQVLEEVAHGLNSGVPPTLEPVILSGFSAGYGAIREILKDKTNWSRISAVVLIDGLHTSYQTGDTPGPLETESLRPFVDFAREAVAGRKRMVITHSEIFPGTFASTTETNDYLLSMLGLKRKPVMKWGPGGMQQLSEVRAGGLHVLGFAGNSAPDQHRSFARDGAVAEDDQVTFTSGAEQGCPVTYSARASYLSPPPIPWKPAVYAGYIEGDISSSCKQRT